MAAPTLNKKPPLMQINADTGVITPAIPAGVKAWLAAALDRAESDLRHGPLNLGWQNNEALRPDIEARAAWLRQILS